jgi:hypothetical protein
VSARRTMRKTGIGYRATDVGSYLRARARGQTAPKPKAKPWRS